jgi:hypothetical protein
LINAPDSKTFIFILFIFNFLIVRLFGIRPVFLSGSWYPLFKCNYTIFSVTLGGQPFGFRRTFYFFKLAHNVLHLQEVGYFEAHNFLPAVNLI